MSDDGDAEMDEVHVAPVGKGTAVFETRIKTERVTDYVVNEGDVLRKGHLEMFCLYAAFVGWWVARWFGVKYCRHCPSSSQLLFFYRGFHVASTLLVIVLLFLLTLYTTDTGRSCCADAGPSLLEQGYSAAFTPPSSCDTAALPNCTAPTTDFDPYCNPQILKQVFSYQAKAAPTSLYVAVIAAALDAIATGMDWWAPASIRRPPVILLILVKVALIVPAGFLLVNKKRVSHTTCEYWKRQDEVLALTSTSAPRSYTTCLTLSTSCGNRLTWLAINNNADTFTMIAIAFFTLAVIQLVVQVPTIAVRLPVARRVAEMRGMA